MTAAYGIASSSFALFHHQNGWVVDREHQVEGGGDDQHNHTKRQQSKDPADAQVADDLLTPCPLKELCTALHSLERSDLLGDQHGNDQEGRQVPCQADELDGDPTQRIAATRE